MEGPSLYLAQQQLKGFKKQKILSVSGNTTIEKERFQDKVVLDIFSWGKHLLFQFDDCALKVHFLLYGTFSATINGASLTGDYKKARVPRLSFIFVNGQIEMYNCSVKIIDDTKLKKSYDYSIDIMSSKWDPVKALKSVREQGEEEIADVLLDQEIFAGVGNIIKNEILSLAYVNPEQKVMDLELAKLKELISLAQSFSHQFLAWRKKFVLRENLLIHRKGVCPHCGGKVTHRKTGKRTRWSHYCPVCQALRVKTI